MLADAHSSDQTVVRTGLRLGDATGPAGGRGTLSSVLQLCRAGAAKVKRSLALTQ